MDGDRFDALTRTFRSRRAALWSLAGGMAGMSPIAWDRERSDPTELNLAVALRQ